MARFARRFIFHLKKGFLKPSLKGSLFVFGQCPTDYVFCFLIPNIILKIPLINLGLFISTTFIPSASENQYLQDVSPSIITQTANTAIKNFGGQKQLIISPKANVTAKSPLPDLPRCLILLPPKLSITLTLYKSKQNVLQKGAFFNALRRLFFVLPWL